MAVMDVLSDADVAAALIELPDWARDGETLTRTLRRPNYRAAIEFIDRIADLAEARNHHPDLCLTGYRTVTIRLTTHSAGGITARDVELAGAIEGLAAG
jgi:4a-hydroxytetrahydrobiopterin dehydratase